MYRERPVSDAAVACVWRQDAVGAVEQLVVPDGCVDVVWLDGRLVVAGPDTVAHTVTLPPGSSAVGVRIAPGAAGSLLGVPAAEVRDALVPAELFGDWTLASADTAPDATTLLAAVWRRRVRVDPVIGRAAGLLGRRRRRIADVAAELGLSERHLHRRCVDAVGYGPKVLDRVLRLRRLVGTRGGLAERAVAAGYASQAHMGDEVRRLTGLTPVRFLEDRRCPGRLAWRTWT